MAGNLMHDRSAVNGFSPTINEVDPQARARWNLLLDILHDMGSAVVAFSGGVDSGLLCAAAYVALGEHMLAVTIHSPVDPPGEVESALALARQIGFAHQVIEHDDLRNAQFVANPPDRCYHCKLARLDAVQRLGRERGLAHALEGSNADDARDYRPGSRAVKELGARSPLAEAGLTKPEIRALARAMHLVIADRPSAPCLATRFPYGSPVTREGLDQVKQAESFLQQSGFGQVRVRHHGHLARLEVASEQIERLAAQRQTVLPYFKQLGFQYIALDLEGYRMGSMNETLSDLQGL